MKLNLKVEKREIGSKSGLTTLRKSGKIPAVVYGEGRKGVNISLDEVEFLKALNEGIGSLVTYTMNIDGEEIDTIIKEKQMHPVTRKYLHVDFLQLIPGRALKLRLPLHFVGEPVGKKLGGRVDIINREIDIYCAPEFIPEAVEVDISSLKIGQNIQLSKVEIPNVTILTPLNTRLVAVHGKRGADIEEETEEETEE